MKNHHYTLLAGLSAVMVIAAYSETAAQQVLEEVIVTAQRRSERLEEVPISITAVSAATLDRHAIVGMDALGRVAAGVQFNHMGGFFKAVIRGISTLPNGNNIEGNVAVYTDGFYDPSSLTINTDLSNVESIQILKGPQGTLYGRNANGGAILINTVGPTKEFTGKLEGGYGRYQEKTASGYVAGPISDSLRFSLSVYHRDTTGFLKLVDPTTIGKYLGNVGEVKRDAVRVKFEFDVTSNLTATLGYGYYYNQDFGASLYTVYEQVNPALEPAPPLRATEYGTVSYGTNTPQPRTYAFRSQGQLKLVYNSPIGTLTSYTGFTGGIDHNQFDFDGSYASVSYLYSKFRSRSWQQSVDYAITAIKNLDLMVGGMYFSDELETPKNGPGNLNFTVNYALAAANYARTFTNAWAVYLDGTYHLSDRLSVNVGGRYSHDKKGIDYSARNGAGVVTVPFGGGRRIYKRFSPRATIRYTLAPQTNAYFSYSKGFLSGNFNAGGPTPGLGFVSTKPEDVAAYEVGFKTAQSIFRFNAAAFYYDYTDISTSVSGPNPLCAPGVACTPIVVFGNAPGGAKIYGVDVEAMIEPVENLEVRVGVEWLHARYGSFANATGTGVNATLTLNVPSQIQDWTGIRLPKAPDFTANLGIDYTIPLSAGSLLLGANVNYTTSYALYDPSLYGPLAPADLQRKERFLQHAYALVSAQLSWRAPDEKYWVTIYGDNLTNHRYFRDRAGTIFGTRGQIAKPLSYGAKVGVKLW